MREQHFGLNFLKTCLERHSPRKVATKIALGVLAMTLIASAAGPAFAGKPHQSRHGGRHEQTQAHGVSAARKGKGAKNKSVKTTFSNSGVIAIPADGSALNVGPADPYPATIAVSGFKKARITDVNLTLSGFNHNFPGDVDVLLVAPGGRNALVIDEVGIVPANNAVVDITLTLDDEAAAALPAENVLTSGSFRPLANADPRFLNFPAPAPAPSGSDALSTFDGINPNGEWQLFIVDDAQDDAGSLADGWSIEITAKAKVKEKGRRKH